MSFSCHFLQIQNDVTNGKLQKNSDKWQMSSANAGIRGTIGKMGIMGTKAPIKSPHACNIVY